MSPIRKEVQIGECRLLLGDCLSDTAAAQMHGDFAFIDRPAPATQEVLL